MKQFKYLRAASRGGIFLGFLTICSTAGAQVTFNSIPSRIVGQPFLQQQGTITSVAPNLVEGRELYNPEAVAIDSSSTPAILYVADTNNNRVLAWKNAAGFIKGDPADKVIGQRDLFSTSAQGPGTTLSTGLTLPLALAVDKSGNLYVSDTGNNRIIRYPSPLKQTGELLAVDLIIGQASLAGRSANEGQATPSAKSLFYSNNTSPFRTGLAFDSQGNLWTSDPGNNRVLRYPVASLTAGNNEPAADLVLGQSDFATNTLPQNPARNQKTFLVSPSGIAFDPQGRLFVADGAYRVVVYTPPYTSGQAAARIMGVILPTSAQPNPPALNESTLGNAQQQAPPEGIFFVGNNPFVLDRGNARILKYDPFDQWPAEATQFSPKAIAVIGQPDFVSNKSNQGQPEPSGSTLSGPVGARSATETNGAIGAVFFGNELYIADAGNNRILVVPQISGGTFGPATRLLGQFDFRFNAPNLIEGREFFFQGAGAGVAIDPNSNPPHLYVSDPGNNRILGFSDYRKVAPGAKADLVLGQADFFSAVVNYPKNDANIQSDQGLALPEGIAVDKAGNLWVADAANGRVLRFPKPFDQPAGGVPRANLVLGQANYFQNIPDASAATMGQPYGIAFTADGSVLVSDVLFNRVLLFRKPAGGDFTNGQAASNVIGQPGFGPPTATSLNKPHMIAVDSDDRLFVADTGNNRIAVYRNVPSAGNDPIVSFSLTGLSSPFGVTVNYDTGEVWVADSGSNHLYRYPRFDTLVSNPMANVTITSFGSLAVALDPFGNPLSAESINRVAFYYPSIDFTNAAGGLPGRYSGNAANYFPRFAPGMLASIFAFNMTHFGLDTGGATSTPLPTTLADVQVSVNGTLAPLLYVSPGQINFQVPSNAPVGSTPVEFQVVKASTGQILASSLFRIDSVSPGLFTADSSGSGQLAAVNQDGTVNSALHPAKAGTFISLYGTGLGVLAGAPPDGTPATGALSTNITPDVFINGTRLEPADINYSGLAPGFIGLWQINAKIPATVPTSGTPVSVVIVFNGVNSRLDEFGDGRTTTIRTTP